MKITSKQIEEILSWYFNIDLDKVKIKQKINAYKSDEIYADVNISQIFNPNSIGEAFRRRYFIGEGLGCYSTFELKEGFEEVNHNLEITKQLKELMRYDDENDWPIQFYIYYYPKDKTYVAWYWDGDGTLLFSDNEYTVMNTDCKKDYEWEFIE